VRVNWESEGRTRRLSKSALNLLEMCAHDGALISYAPRTGQFTLCLNGDSVQSVPSRTVGALVAAGLLNRTNDAAPRYTLNDRGRAVLRAREARLLGGNQ
jgi:hypothetical protein